MNPNRTLARRSLTGLTLAASMLLTACNTLPTQPDSAKADAATGDASAQRALENRPTHLALVRQMQGNGLWFASLAHIDALEQRWGAAADSRLLRAEALRHSGQPDASAKLYESLLDTPERAAALRGLGLIAGGQGRFAEAARQFEQARTLLPTDGLLLNDLGYALLMDGRTDQARVPLMQADQLLPQHPKVRSNLALWLIAQGQPAAARQLMDEAGLSLAARQAIERQSGRLTGASPSAAAPAATHTASAVDAPAPASAQPLRLSTRLQLVSTTAPAPETAR